MAITSITRTAEDALHYPEGSVIFKAGERADEMFYVVEGEVEIQLQARCWTHWARPRFSARWR